MNTNRRIYTAATGRTSSLAIFPTARNAQGEAWKIVNGYETIEILAPVSKRIVRDYRDGTADELPGSGALSLLFLISIVFLAAIAVVA